MNFTSNFIISPRTVDGYTTPGIAISEQGAARAVALVYAGFGDGVKIAKLLVAAPDMAQALKALLHNPDDATVRVAAEYALGKAGAL